MTLPKINPKLFFLASTVPVLLISGILENPLLSVFIFSLYEMGLLGLVTMYNSPYTKKPLASLLLGFSVLLFAWFMLNITSQVIPY